MVKTTDCQVLDLGIDAGWELRSVRNFICNIRLKNVIYVYILRQSVLGQ